MPGAHKLVCASHSSSSFYSSSFLFVLICTCAIKVVNQGNKNRMVKDFRCPLRDSGN